MGQVATPVAGSTSRKLAQPFVRQYGRVEAFAWMARRRSRRMELARPTVVEVAERDNMWEWVTLAFCAPHGVPLPSAARSRIWRIRRPDLVVPVRSVGPGGVSGASV